MSVLNSKIDFVALVSVTMANANGDPLNGNRPRTDYNNFGEISDVCIKRKIRNRMLDLGHKIFVQSEDKQDPNDTFPNLKMRAESVLSSIKGKDVFETRKLQHDKACETWLDVRSFGQLFAFSGDDKTSKKGSGVSLPVRGPVSIHIARSFSPVDIETMQITKSISGDAPKKKKEDEEGGNSSKTSDTMGMKHFVRFGLYKIKGSINVQLAQKTGFTEEDAEVVKECLCTLFENDASSARPEGSMEVVRLYWWKHNCASGQYSSAKVHRLVDATLRTPGTLPSCVEDYDITLDSLPGLEPEILDGL